MYLGREWQRVTNGFVSRTPMHYVHGLLSQERLEYAKGVDTPFIPAEPEDDDKPEPVDEYVRSRYRGVVGRLMWLVGDRPDLAYAVKELARAVAEPQKRDEQAMKRALKYISSTQSWCMWFVHKPEEKTDTIRVFVDASWASGRGRRSTSGGLITVAGFPMMWWSRTQPTIAQSSCEAELLAANTGATEARFLQSLMEELGVTANIIIETDSSSAEKVTRKRGVGRMRHLAIKELWLQDEVRSGRIEVKHVKGLVNPADLMTKALPRKRLWELCELVGLQPMEA